MLGYELEDRLGLHTEGRRQGQLCIRDRAYIDLFEGVCFELTSSWSPARVEGWVPSRGPNPISAVTRLYPLMRADADEFPDRILFSTGCVQQKHLLGIGGPRMRKMRSNSIWGPMGAHGVYLMSS